MKLVTDRMKSTTDLKVEALSVVNYLPTSRIFEAELFGQAIIGEIHPSLTAMPISGLLCKINVLVESEMYNRTFTLTKCEVWGNQ